MTRDNQWHEGIVFVNPSTDNITLVDTVEEANAMLKPHGKTLDSVEHRLCKHNWNRGQPIVDFQNGERWTITDLER